MSGQLKPLPIVSSSSSDISEAEEDPPQRPRPLQFFYTTKMNSISNGNGNAKGISNDDDRSDTESPVGPVKNKARPNDLAEAAGQNPPAGGGGHSYVNYPPDEEPPPVSRNLEPDQPRRERARFSGNFGHAPLVVRKSRSRERPIGGFPGNKPLTPGNRIPSSPESSQQQQIKDRERELERIHRRSRELMLSPRLMDVSAVNSSRDSSVDRQSTLSNRTCTSPPRAESAPVNSWKPVGQEQQQQIDPHQQQQPPPLPPRISSPPPSSGNNVQHQHNGGGATRMTNGRYKSPSPGVAPPLPPHQPRSTLTHPFLNPHQASNGARYVDGHAHHHPVNSSGIESLRRRVQSPRRRDFKDFSAAPREVRSPVRAGHNGSHFLPRGYLDEDDDSGADSLNEHTGSSGGSQFGNCSVPACIHCHQHAGGPHQTGANGPMALVPYKDPHYGCCVNNMQLQETCCCPRSYSRASACGGCHHLNSRAMSPASTSMALQTINTDDKFRELEGDKESLRLQVVVLSDQVDSQSEKIGDLEKLLEDKKEVLRRTEDILQREMINRSALETKKLELMSDLSQLKLRQAAIEKENLELRKKLGKTMHLLNDVPPATAANQLNSSNNATRASSVVQTFGTLPKVKRSPSKGSKESTVPPLETHFNAINGGDASSSSGKNNNPEKSGLSLWSSVFSTGSRKMSNAHSGSAPSLVSAGELLERGCTPKAAVTSKPPKSSKTGGLKRIFGKMRRSSSGNLHDDNKKKNQNQPHSEASRPSLKPLSTYSHLTQTGSYRASEGSRFSGWLSTGIDSTLPFDQWNIDLICGWLESQGLLIYTPEVRKHVTNGEQLAAMTSHDLDIKLGMKNGLHRKKLLLAIRSKYGDALTPELGPHLKIKMDHQLVVRWLDDIGLPQYKERFLEAAIDGRLLNMLTSEDLCMIKVTNLLHHLSIKRGIQILRKYAFDLSYLQRRSKPIPTSSTGNNNPFSENNAEAENPDPNEIAQWTNQRVMEWLRTANLSEYAPNLRGSGVHGALMVFEPNFNADLLAGLLSIPSQKSLLRRHLSLHFSDLVGKNVMATKREAESSPNYQPLTASAKVKISKRSQFTLTRRRHKSSSSSKGSDLEFLDDLLCPLDPALNEINLPHVDSEVGLSS